ncbi:MAG: hypothetical protein ACYC0H_20230 [Solirubrobacteraceae bacterium]
MNASRPEAESEYSRGQGLIEPDSEPVSPRISRSRRVPQSSPPIGMRVGGALGAALLVAAELTTIFTVHEARAGTVVAVSGGPHHRWALLPIAALVALLSLGRGRAPAQPARRRPSGMATRALALCALGLVALIIAIGIDLPDSRSAGLIGQAGHPYVAAAASAGPGLYLETLGAVAVLLASAAGLLWHRRVASTAGAGTVGP